MCCDIVTTARLGKLESFSVNIGLQVESTWIPHRQRIADFLRENLGLLRAGPGTPGSTQFVPKLLVEGLGYSEAQGIRYGTSGLWVVDDDDNQQFMIVEQPRGSALSASLSASDVTDFVVVAATQGISWIWLTNGAEWRVYHHEHKNNSSWLDFFLSAALLDGSPPERQAERLLPISREAVSRGTLNEIWELRAHLRPDKLIAAINSDHVAEVFTRELSSYQNPDEKSFNEILLSDIGLDAVRTALFDSHLEGLRLPLFVVRAAIEFNLERK